MIGPVARPSAALRRVPGWLWLVLAVAVLVVATIVWGSIRVAAGEDIGAPLPPTLFRFKPDFGALSGLAAAVVAAAVLLSRPLLSVRVPVPGFLLSALALALAIRLAVNSGREGPEDLWIFFDPRFGEGTLEYLAALPALEPGLGIFLDRFAESAAGYPVHVVGHPPGLLTLVGLLGIETPQAFAALIIGVGVLVVPLTYAIARELLDEPRARIAALLVTLAPSAVIYGASPADALFATLAALAALGLVARRRSVAALGPPGLALASFFSYANLAVGAWAVLVVLLRRGPRAAAVRAAAAGAGLVVFYALLYAATGYDPFGTLATTEDIYRVGIARLRPYEYFVVGSPAAWLLALGLPLAVLWVRAIAARDAAALALAAVIVVSALGGFTKGETERIWLFMVPLACVGAAAVVPPRWVVPVLALLAVQAYLMHHLLGTAW